MLLPSTSSDNFGPNQGKMLLKGWPRGGKFQLIVVSFVLVALIYLTFQTFAYLKTSSNHSCSPVSRFFGGDAISSDLKGELPPLEFPDLSPEDYHNLCFPALDVNDHGIAITYAKVQSLMQSENQACRNVANILGRIYEFSKETGEIKLPDQFVPQVKQWLNNDEKLFAAVGSQDVYTVVNKVYGESSIYNTLRSKRPQSKPPMDPLEYIEKTFESTSQQCDFCKFRQHTAEDVFGRIISKHSASASNTFKMAKFHGLFFPIGHHPLNISFETLADLFVNTAQLWLKKATETDPLQIYPALLWDTLPHAGASQVHPHVHGLLDDSQYVGTYGVLNAVSHQYFTKFGSNLISDMLLVHWALGLVVVEGTAAAIVPVTARKDYEYMIISSTLNLDAVKLLWRVLQAYKTKLGVYCFSAGGSLPVMNSPNIGLPFIFRIGSRGDCSAVRSDVSSLELYLVNNINADMGKTVTALKETSEL